MHLPISRPMKDSTISAAIHQKLISYSGFMPDSRAMNSIIATRKTSSACAQRLWSLSSGLLGLLFIKMLKMSATGANTHR